MNKEEKKSFDHILKELKSKGCLTVVLDCRHGEYKCLKKILNNNKSVWFNIIKEIYVCEKIIAREIIIGITRKEVWTGGNKKWVK